MNSNYEKENSERSQVILFFMKTIFVRKTLIQKKNAETYLFTCRLYTKQAKKEFFAQKIQ